MDKQIMEILENRPLIEGLVVGSFLKNLTLYGEFKVSVDDFEYDKMKYLFSLGRAMSENHEELDEASLVSFLNSNKKLQENYEEYGGWDTIKKAINLGNDNNIEAYIDDLAKNNFLLNIREMLGVNVTEEMELYGQTFSPFYDKFGEMKCREVEHFYEGILSSCVVQSINQQVKAENLLITSKDKEKLKQKIDCGLPYDIIFSYTEKEVGLSDNEEVKYIYGLPTLSTITNGLGNGGGISIMAGHSGLGKSTLTFFDFILSMWYRGEKCLIFSNDNKVNTLNLCYILL